MCLDSSGTVGVIPTLFAETIFFFKFHLTLSDAFLRNLRLSHLLRLYGHQKYTNTRFLRTVLHRVHICFSERLSTQEGNASITLRLDCYVQRVWCIL